MPYIFLDNQVRSLFCYNIFIVSFMGQTDLTHSHTTTPFDAPGNKPFENTVGKGEIARYEKEIACNEQFLLYPLCFLLI